MKRRNFLKYLSSIPLIGIPVKAEKKSGWNGIIESRSNVSLYKSKIDPYEDVVGKGFKEQLLKASKSKNPFHEGMNRGVRAKWRRV